MAPTPGSVPAWDLSPRTHPSASEPVLDPGAFTITLAMGAIILVPKAWKDAKLMTNHRAIDSTLNNNLTKLAECLVATRTTHIVERDELPLPTEQVGFGQGIFFTYLTQISLKIWAQNDLCQISAREPPRHPV